jgi:hypothetical protein
VKHWSIVIYQAFFAFIHLGTISAEDAFYADLAQPSEVAKEILFFMAVLLGDALVVRPTDFHSADGVQFCLRHIASG